MSYTPTIIVKKDDFYKHSESYNNHYMNVGDDEKVFRYLNGIYESHDICSIDHVEFVLICADETSSLNKLIRNKLDELDIQYTLSN